MFATRVRSTVRSIVFAALTAAMATEGADMVIGLNMSEFYASEPSFNPFVQGVNFATAWNSGKTNGVTNVSPWKQTYLDDIAPFKVLRFMEYAATNGNTSSDFSAVMSPTDPRNNNSPWCNAYAGEQCPIPAYEWMCDLCNRIKADMWVCVPTKADVNPSFVTSIATVIRNNLDPSLKVYVEYSNETWNGGFWQSDYCRQRGAAIGLPGDTYEKGFLYQAVGAIAAWRGFESVFGQGSPRLVRVLAGWAANLWVAQQMWSQVILSSTYNPTGIRPDALATAPYVGHEINGSGSNWYEQLMSELNNSRSLYAQFKTWTQSVGIKLITYEGSMHITSNAIAVNRDPRMYDFHAAYHQVLSDYFSLHMHFCSSAPFSDGSAWGMKEYIGQPAAQAPKYRALIDWINAHSVQVRPEHSTQPIAPRQRPAITVGPAAAPGCEGRWGVVITQRQTPYSLMGQRLDAPAAAMPAAIENARAAH